MPDPKTKKPSLADTLLGSPKLPFDKKKSVSLADMVLGPPPKNSNFQDQFLNKITDLNRAKVNPSKSEQIESIYDNLSKEVSKRYEMDEDDARDFIKVNAQKDFQFSGYELKTDIDNDAKEDELTFNEKLIQAAMPQADVVRRIPSTLIGNEDALLKANGFNSFEELYEQAEEVKLGPGLQATEFNIDQEVEEFKNRKSQGAAALDAFEYSSKELFYGLGDLLVEAKKKGLQASEYLGGLSQEKIEEKSKEVEEFAQSITERREKNQAENLNNEYENYWTNKLASAVPSFVPMVSGAAISTRSPQLGGKVMQYGFGLLSASTAGSAMREYEEYQKANGREVDELDKWATGVGSAAVEYITERAPVSKFLGRNVRRNLAKGALTHRIKLSPQDNLDFGKAVLKSYSKNQPKKFKKLLSELSDVGKEGASESVAELLQASISNYYKDNKDKLQGDQIFRNMADAFFIGSAMRAGISPISYNNLDRAINQRREAQGGVVLTEYNGEAVEIISRKEKEGKLQYTAMYPDGEVVEISAEKAGELFKLSNEQFQNLLRAKGEEKTIQENIRTEKQFNTKTQIDEKFKTDEAKLVNEEGVEVFREGLVKDKETEQMRPVTVINTNGNKATIRYEDNGEKAMISVRDIEELKEFTKDDFYKIYEVDYIPNTPFKSPSSGEKVIHPTYGEGVVIGYDPTSGGSTIQYTDNSDPSDPVPIVENDVPRATVDRYRGLYNELKSQNETSKPVEVQEDVQPIDPFNEKGEIDLNPKQDEDVSTENPGPNEVSQEQDSGQDKTESDDGGSSNIDSQIKDLAERISKGEQNFTAADLQLQMNEAKKLEKELNRISNQKENQDGNNEELDNESESKRRGSNNGLRNKDSSKEERTDIGEKGASKRTKPNTKSVKDEKETNQVKSDKEVQSKDSGQQESDQTTKEEGVLDESDTNTQSEGKKDQKGSKNDPSYVRVQNGVGESSKMGRNDTSKERSDNDVRSKPDKESKNVKVKPDGKPKRVNKELLSQRPDLKDTDHTNAASTFVNAWVKKHKPEIEETAKKEMKKLGKNRPELEVYESDLDLVLNYPQLADQIRVDGRAGFFTVEKGKPKVVLIGTNPKFRNKKGEVDSREVADTVIHEMIGHYGLRGSVEALGGKKEDLFARLEEARPGMRKSRLDKITKRYAGKDSFSEIKPDDPAYYEILEEYVAHEVQLNNIDGRPKRNGVTKSVIDYIKGLLEKLGFEFTDSQLRAMISNARKFVEQGESYFAPRKTVSLEEIDTMKQLGQLPEAFQIAPPVEIEAFKKWFGDSKVVDENGDPLVVYHGTTKDLSVFDKSKAGKNTGADNFNTKAGFYFTPDSTLAEDFTRRSWTNEKSKLKKGANIIPTYLSIQNPKEITARQFVNGYFSSNTQDDLIDQGFDGVVISPFTTEDKESWDNIFGKNSGSKEFDYPQYIAFSPTQIKSATGNIGTYDSNNPDIRFQKTSNFEGNEKDSSQTQQVRQGESEEGSGALLESTEAHIRGSLSGTRTQQQEDLEQQALGQYAKDNNLLISSLYDLGIESNAGGVENKIAINVDEGLIYKSNNLLTHKGSILNYFNYIKAHNALFLETAYELVGFQEIQKNKKPFYKPIVKQKYYSGVRQAAPTEIEEYMNKMGYETWNAHTFQDDNFTISDLRPNNVLINEDGAIFVIDNRIKARNAEYKGQVSFQVVEPVKLQFTPKKRLNSRQAIKQDQIKEKYKEYRKLYSCFNK